LIEKHIKSYLKIQAHLQLPLATEVHVKDCYYDGMELLSFTKPT